MKKKKVIHIIGSMNIGGAETFLINVLKNIDKSKYEFVFLCYGDDKFDYEEEIKKEHGRIVRINIPNNVGYFTHIKELKDIFDKEKPDIVHAHTYYNSAFAMMVAKKMGIKIRIAHSHSTKSDLKESLVYKAYKILMKYMINKYSNVYFACGNEAGKSLFYKSKKYEIIYNGIETERFIFDKNIRRAKREELKIKEEEFVIGHVGRFVPLKNQLLLVKIFSSYLKVNSNSKLIFIGEGPMEKEVREKVLENKIQERVLFLGKRKDVNELYSVMDLFIFPSVYEGFPVTLIETQINGLMSLVSNNIDKTVKRTENIEFFNIEENISTIIELIQKNKKERKINDINIKELDIKHTVKKMCEFYESEKI